MSELDSFLASYQPPTTGTAEVIAEHLRSAAEKAGLGPRIDGDQRYVVYLYKGDRIVTVFVGAGSKKELRQAVRRFVGGRPVSPEAVLVAAPKAPGDVRRFFGADPMGNVSRRVLKDGYVDDDLEFQDASVAEACEKASEHFGAFFGEKLPVDGGVATLEAIDRVIARMRPEGVGDDVSVDKDAVEPTFLLRTLALFASETARRLAGTDEFVAFKGDDSDEVSNFRDAGKDLGIVMPNDGVVNFGEAVFDRWRNGLEHSVKEEWDMGVEVDGMDLSGLGRGDDEEDEGDDEEEGGGVGAIELTRFVEEGPIGVYLLLGHAKDRLDEDHLITVFFLRFRDLRGTLLKFLLMRGPTPVEKAKAMQGDAKRAERSVFELGNWLRGRGGEGEKAIEELLGIARASLDERAKPAFFGLFGPRKLQAADAEAYARVEKLIRGLT